MAAMIRAGRFSVEEPCVIARVVSTPEPLPRNADATGTMHAEHKVHRRADKQPLQRSLDARRREAPAAGLGEQKCLGRPATRKAKAMPTDTSLKYVREKSHHRDRRDDSGGPSMQKPWEALGHRRRGHREVGLYGVQLRDALNIRKSVSRTATNAMPRMRRFLVPLS